MMTDQQSLALARERLRIAMDALDYIDRDEGLKKHPTMYPHVAHDALIQISVAEVPDD